MRPIVLTIAGSDPSGGAGIQADIKAIEAHRGCAAAVITALTAQNGRGVTRISGLAPDLVRDQLDAVFSDMDVGAVKTGMFGDADVVGAVAGALRRIAPRHFVLDPVLCASSGTEFLSRAGVDALRRELCPLATLLTPNVPEAQRLGGKQIESLADAERAGRRLLDLGCGAVLIKGGHLPQEPATDVLVTRTGSRVFRAEWVDTVATHGTGCTYSAAIATLLARGFCLEPAIEQAKRFVTRKLRQERPAGEGPGRLHVISDETLQSRFDHVELARIVSRAGADVVQFREKREWTTARLVRTAREMREVVHANGKRLVVNDRVDVALASGADGVHLGAHDLDPALARELLGGAARIGSTAHDAAELAGLECAPLSYVGIGPVFGTASKVDPAPRLGLGELGRMVRSVDRPVIAIGGMTPERASRALGAGAHGVAVLSDVVCAADPAERVSRFLEALESARVPA